MGVRLWVVVTVVAVLSVARGGTAAESEWLQVVTTLTPPAVTPVVEPAPAPSLLERAIASCLRVQAAVAPAVTSASCEKLILESPVVVEDALRLLQEKPELKETFAVADSTQRLALLEGTIDPNLLVGFVLYNAQHAPSVRDGNRIAAQLAQGIMKQGFGIYNIDMLLRTLSESDGAPVKTKVVARRAGGRNVPSEPAELKVIPCLSKVLPEVVQAASDDQFSAAQQSCMTIIFSSQAAVTASQS